MSEASEVPRAIQTLLGGAPARDLYRAIDRRECARFSGPAARWGAVLSRSDIDRLSAQPAPLAVDRDVRVEVTRTGAAFANAKVTARASQVPSFLACGFDATFFRAETVLGGFDRFLRELRAALACTADWETRVQLVRDRTFAARPLAVEGDAFLVQIEGACRWEVVAVDGIASSEQLVAGDVLRVPGGARLVLVAAEGAIHVVLERKTWSPLALLAKALEAPHPSVVPRHDGSAFPPDSWYVQVLAELQQRVAKLTPDDARRAHEEEVAKRARIAARPLAPLDRLVLGKDVRFVRNASGHGAESLTAYARGQAVLDLPAEWDALLEAIERLREFTAAELWAFLADDATWDDVAAALGRLVGAGVIERTTQPLPAP